jgi:AMP-polyphosphate phosphotransferase
MFQIAEIAHHLPKEMYHEEEAKLRSNLLDAQLEFTTRKNASIVVIVAGVDGAGKGDSVNLLNTWLDPRHVQTHGMGGPTDEELERPYLWRFWRRLPPKGNTAIFFGSWYTQPIVQRTYGQISDEALDQSMERIRRFEQMLTDEGVIVLKLWFHLSKDDQSKRLKRLEKNKHTRWRVTKMDWRHFEMYDDFKQVSTRALRLSSTDNAPWIIVPGAEDRFRSLTVGRAMLAAISGQAAVPETPPDVALNSRPSLDDRCLLRTLDLSQSIKKKTYEKKLEELQGKLNLLIRNKKFASRSLLIVFEGSDAAGKGGTIRRITGALDARSYQVVPIAAPTDEELARPYLWRFWRHAPHHRKVVIFDRSWYGRVLVERVEQLCKPADWLRGYSEINDFEEQLIENGTILVKLWLHIDEEEQLRRFKEREEVSFKRYKITPEDWRNREKWHQYELAVDDMVERTSTELAPWTMIEANDKYFARIKAMETIVNQLQQAFHSK